MITFSQLAFSLIISSKLVSSYNTSLLPWTINYFKLDSSLLTKRTLLRAFVFYEISIDSDYRKI